MVGRKFELSQRPLGNHVSGDIEIPSHGRDPVLAVKHLAECIEPIGRGLDDFLRIQVSGSPARTAVGLPEINARDQDATAGVHRGAWQFGGFVGDVAAGG
jgi:hypothetical protein